MLGKYGALFVRGKDFSEVSLGTLGTGYSRRRSRLQ